MIYLQKSAIIVALFAATSIFAQDVFTPTGSLIFSQTWPGDVACITLNNGKVMVMGGSDSHQAFADCEIFDPSTGVWTTTGSMKSTRVAFGSTILPDGRVIAIGGIDQSNQTTTSCEIYDPLTGTWSDIAPLSEARFFHIAVRLNSGRVLVAGGRASLSGYSGPNCSEIYDPVTDTWTKTGAVNITRTAEGTRAVLLSNGKVLLAGGANTNQCEVYDPSTGIWTITGPMSGIRNQNFAMISLQNGLVLAAGGQQMCSATVTDQAETYDPTTGAWSPVTALPNPLCAYSATVLPDGKVLFAGGSIDPGTRTDAAILFEPSNRTWSVLNAKLATARSGHLSALLPNGNVLIFGGLDQGSKLLNSCEIFLHSEIYNAQLIRTWGGTGSSDGRFIGVQGVTIDKAGNVYAADMVNNRIQKFDSTGVFITKWSVDGQPVVLIPA